jgi:epoxyqueuosine reductase
MDKKLTESLKKKGREAGADIVGIAGAEELLDIAPECDAGLFLEGARNVVIALVADPPAVQHATDIGEYIALAFPGYQKADGAVRSMMNFIEHKGFRTHFITREWHMAKNRFGRNVNTMSLKQAARAAGLGSIGRHTLLVTPDHGPRVRLSGFITDAPLGAGAPFEATLCDDCGACIAACPSGALNGQDDFGFNACSAYLFAGIRLDEVETAAREMNMSALLENAQRLARSAVSWMDSLASGRKLYYNCSACIRVCNAHKRAAPVKKKKT